MLSKYDSFQGQAYYDTGSWQKEDYKIEHVFQHISLFRNAKDKPYIILDSFHRTAHASVRGSRFTYLRLLPSALAVRIWQELHS